MSAAENSAVDIRAIAARDTTALRGMATLSEYRGRGLGKGLAQRCIAYGAKQEGTIVWCTSRIATVPFYQVLGFVECGEPFRLQQYSDAVYIRMTRSLP